MLVLYTVVIVLISYWYYRLYKYKKCLEKIPGPPPLPIVGNSLEFSSPTVILSKFLKYKEQYGGMVKIHIGPFPTLILVQDYNFIEFILSSTKILNKSAEYVFLRNWLGTGLLLSDGDEKWRKHRKIITPTFHFQILEQFVSIIESTSNILVEKLKKEVGKPSVDISTYITLCTLDIICETAMGTSIKAQENSESDYVKSVHQLSRMIIDRTFSIFLRPDITYKLSSAYRKEKKAVRILHDYTNSVIRKRKADLKSVKNSENVDDVGIKKKLAFLDLLLQEQEKNESLSDDDIREEVDTFMFAGHDTTSAAISFAMYCLSTYLDVQKSAVEELEKIFEDDPSRFATLQDLQEMKYLEAVIKETLRLYPSVPFYARNVHETFEYDGVTFPKDMTLTICSFVIHRDPKLFEDPLEFRPERFFSENTTGRLPYGYIPFSAGPRNCIGQKFAMLEMKSVLSTLLRNYEILPTVPGHQLILSSETVLKSANGICVRLAEKKM